MRDPVFTGSDEAAAVAEAARTLGVAVAELRYVVLDAGVPAGRSAPSVPARIAVIVGPPARPVGPRVEARPREHSDPVAAAEQLIAALATTVGGAIQVERVAGERNPVLALSGEGTRVLLHDNGETLEALTLLLQRIAANLDPGARLEVRCAAVRERRDQHLREEALAVARAVAQDGRPRPMPALNAYDRRIVHMAVAEVHGVGSQSEGEGRERRVVVVPRPESAHA